MARLGSAEYPDMMFTDALQTIEAIKRERITTVEALAKHLGYKSAVNNGAFNGRAAALNKYYGLIEQNKNDVMLTKLANRILHPIEEGSREAACSEAVMRVPLFRELHAKLGSMYNRNDFLPRLKEITQAEPQDLAEKGTRVEKLYQDVLRHMSRTEAPATISEQQSPRVSGEIRPPAGQAPPSVPEGDFAIIQIDDTYIRVRREEDSIEEAKDALDLLLKKVRRIAAASQ